MLQLQLQQRIRCFLFSFFYSSDKIMHAADGMSALCLLADGAGLPARDPGFFSDTAPCGACLPQEFSSVTLRRAQSSLTAAGTAPDLHRLPFCRSPASTIHYIPFCGNCQPFHKRIREYLCILTTKTPRQLSCRGRFYKDHL